MRFVTSLAFSPLDHYCDIARACEQAGFEGVALSDHVVHPETIQTPYPYTPDGKPRWEPFTPWPDPWVAIAAMAAVTTRLRFVTSVYVLPMRNPFQVAKTVGTAAVISNDRVALGIGAGWMEEEFELLEQPFRQRGKRMDEMIEVMRKLWAGGMVEHHGEIYDFDRLEMSPVPRRPIPIYVGGLSKPALRRAARHDGWISDLHSTAELKEIILQLRALREQIGRGGEPLHVLASATDAFDIDGYRRLGEVGVTHLLTMPWIFYGGTLDSLDSKKEGIRRFGEEIIARIGVGDQDSGAR
jgi:probable F420-dependent oxidoreductase